MTERKTMIVAAAIFMVAAALLRLPGIGEQSYWADEIVSINLASRPVGEILTVEDGFPPLYALLVKALGPQAAANFSVRKLSAVFGVLSVGIILLLGARLYDLRTGVFAALLLTLSPLHVWYSREGRMYAVMVFLSILSSLLLQDITRKGRWGARAAFLGIALGGLLIHYVYAGMIAAQLLYLLTRLTFRKIQLRWFVISLIAIAALSWALYPIVKEAIIHWPLGLPREFRLFSLPYTAFTFVSGFGIGPPLEELHRVPGFSAVLGYWPEVFLVIIIGAIVGTAGLRASFQEKTSGLRLYLFLWLIVPPAIAIFISWTAGTAYNVRYAITSLPAFILMVGFGLARHGRLFAVTGLALLVIISFVSIARDRLNPRYAREDIRSSSKYLETAVEKQDRIYSCAACVSSVFEYYYKGSHKIEFLPVRPVETEDDVHRILNVFSENQRQTWLVLSRDWEEDPDGLLEKELAKNQKAELAAVFPGVKIYRIKK
ncbi:MAG: glycosyltransferase family 39 protein [Desulfobacterales bacterium]